MTYATGPDALCYPGTSVLINLLDVRTQGALDEAELAFFLTRSDEHFPTGAFDVAHYLNLHRHLFQDIYAWAGTLRTIRIGKGGNWFCYPEYISTQLIQTFADLGDQNDLVRPSHFVARTSHFLTELNAIRPFRDGNGRTQMAFLAMLANRAGLPFQPDVIEKDRVLDAMVYSFAGDESRLAALIGDIVRR